METGTTKETLPKRPGSGQFLPQRGSPSGQASKTSTHDEKYSINRHVDDTYDNTGSPQKVKKASCRANIIRYLDDGHANTVLLPHFQHPSDQGSSGHVVDMNLISKNISAIKKQSKIMLAVIVSVSIVLTVGFVITMALIHRNQRIQVLF